MCAAYSVVIKWICILRFNGRLKPAVVSGMPIHHSDAITVRGLFPVTRLDTVALAIGIEIIEVTTLSIKAGANVVIVAGEGTYFI